MHSVPLNLRFYLYQYYLRSNLDIVQQHSKLEPPENQGGNRHAPTNDVKRYNCLYL